MTYPRTGRPAPRQSGARDQQGPGVSLAIVQILTLSLGLMPGNVRQELISGTIERFLVSAHGPVNGILGTMLFPQHLSRMDL